jgi:hypothetical protein
MDRETWLLSSQSDGGQKIASFRILAVMQPQP